MAREIGTNEKNIVEFIKMLAEGRFLIPSFQREVVWEPPDIIKLWDSIYRFYPIGSLLYWETDILLNIHRGLGGFTLPAHENPSRPSGHRQYILDGQQRATSLLIPLLGGTGKVKGHKGFDYTLYFDAVSAMFFFGNEYKSRRRETNPAFLVRLGLVYQGQPAHSKTISSEPGFTGAIDKNLRRLDRVFSDYRLSLISIKGFDIPAVREIFERINQEGKELSSTDIMVARTFQNYDCKVEED
jgi:uncharacterized protein with ParB-like and HNH nuclease domain